MYLNIYIERAGGIEIEPNDSILLTRLDDDDFMSYIFEYYIYYLYTITEDAALRNK